MGYSIRTDCLGSDMNASQLDRVIEIYVKTPQQNTFGEITYVDSLLAQVSAQVLPINGKETFLAAQVVPEPVLRILIRYRSDVDTTAKVHYESKVYDIAHVSEIGRRDGLQLLVKLP